MATDELATPILSKYKCRNTATNIKLILIGDSGVGKTSLINKYFNNIFTEAEFQTICVDFVHREYTSHTTGQQYELYVWDTAGQERFQSMITQYYRGSHGAIICFDINNSASFISVPRWITTVRRIEPTVNIILCGTKLDKSPDCRQVTQNTASMFAEENNISYIETSAQNGANINTVFEHIIEHIIEHNITTDMPHETKSKWNSGKRKTHKPTINLTNSRILINSDDDINTINELPPTTHTQPISITTNLYNSLYNSTIWMKNKLCTIL